MNKTWLVAQREYISTVRRKAFIIMTLGMPLFFTAMAGFSGGLAMLAIRAGKAGTPAIGIVDEGNLVKFQLLERVQVGLPKPVSKSSGQPLDSITDIAQPGRRGITGGSVTMRMFASRPEASAAFHRNEVRGYYVIPRNFLETGEIELEIKRAGLFSEERPGWNVVQRLVQASLVHGKVEEPIAQRLWNPARLKTTVLTESGKKDVGSGLAKIADFAVPYSFALLFLLAIIGTAGYLLQGVAEEKENRVIEILISSVTPDQLLAGKVLGLCAAGLTQILVWVLIGVGPAVFFLPFLELRWSQLVVALVFFLLGFLLFGTLMAGSGSLGNSYKESQQMSIIWTLCAVSPMFALMVLLQEPNGTVARALSYFPLTAPITMMVRISADVVPWWDVALSVIILCGSSLLFVRLGGKLFRVGVLLYGKRPSVVEILRCLKAA